MSTVRKHMLVTGTTIGVLVSALLVVMGRSTPQEVAQAVAPPEVEVVPVAQRDVPVYGEWIGTLEGMVNATIKAQVTGYLRQQRYTEGALVTQGQVLFEIDQRPFQAALDQAKGELAKAQGQLVQANAQLVQANAQLAGSPSAIAAGPFEPTMESLTNYHCPEWFRDSARAAPTDPRARHIVGVTGPRSPPAPDATSSPRPRPGP